MRTALTIAGSDSGGGAGIQADLKTFAAQHVFGLSAITAVTAQNTRGVRAVMALPPDLVRAQIDAVVTDFGAAATKVGMLANAAIIAAVVSAIREHQLQHVVLDTVMIAKSGAALLDKDAVDALRAGLVPLAEVVTPNVHEAEALTGLRILQVDDLHQAARRLVSLGARAALVKGGHLKGPAIDVLWDGRTAIELRAERIPTRQTHGTGCTLSAAKDYVTRAISQAPGIGHGHGPLQHFPK